MEDSSKSRQHGVALLVHRRKSTADAANSGDPCRTAKGARNLLLHFGPAQVPLGLVVRKRNPQVVEQGQHLLGTPKQRIQQILGLALLALACARSCGRGGWGALRSITSRPKLQEGRDPGGTLEGGDSGQGGPTALVAPLIPSEPEILPLCRP